MKTGERKALFVRIFAEFLAIFAGVVLALTADGWAEQRAEERAASAGLRLVLGDLEQDSAQFVVVRLKMSEWADATAWLLLQWDRSDVPADSVAHAFDVLTQGESLRLSNVGFDGLRDANRLRFIPDADLVNRLRDYYQIRQPQVGGSYDRTIELVDELPRLAAPYLVYGSDETARTRWQPLAPAGVTVRRAWSEVSGDPVLHQSLVWFGRWTGYVIQLLEESETSVGEILEEVRSTQHGSG